MTDKEILRLVELKKQERNIKEELEHLTADLNSHMESKGIDRIDIPEVGKVFRQERRKYVYPASIKKLEADLKEKKHIAEQTGKATYEISHVVVFRESRVESDAA